MLSSKIVVIKFKKKKIKNALVSKITKRLVARLQNNKSKRMAPSARLRRRTINYKKPGKISQRYPKKHKQKRFPLIKK